MTDNHPDGMPWWVKAITFFGVPSAIALYLVYILATTIASATVLNTNTLIRVAQQSTELINTIERERQEDRYNNIMIQQILQAMCYNAAASSDERANCFMATGNR